MERHSKEATEAITLEGHIKLNEGMGFYINVAEFGIGRSVTNDLFVDSAKISRSHVKIITCPDDSYELRDLGSANGTSLTGRKLEKNEICKLRRGEIQLAGVFHIKFSDFGATDVTPETKTVYGITLSHADRRIWMQGAETTEELRLSNSEYQFLKLLMDAYPEPVSHRDLAFTIWGWEPDNPDDEKRVRDALFNIVKRLANGSNSLILNMNILKRCVNGVIEKAVTGLINSKTILKMLQHRKVLYDACCPFHWSIVAAYAVVAAPATCPCPGQSDPLC